MAYSRTTWTNGKSPYLNATNLNKIENGIYNNSLDISKNEDELSSMSDNIDSNTQNIQSNTENIQINADNILGLSTGEMYQGEFTPTGGAEYPIGALQGYTYYVIGLGDSGYEFTTGDISGRVANNNDKMIYNGTEWSMLDNSTCKDYFFIVDNVTAMLQTNPVDGSRCELQGYNTRNDGGGGSFNYDSTQSGVNNGGTIIDGWVREDDSHVNVKWFGAVGNGLVDDSVAINNAVDYVRDIIYAEQGETPTLYNQGYGIKLVFPSGEYLVTAPINMTEINNAHAWWYVDARGAVIFSQCTGKTTIDLMGSRKCHWLGGTIIGEQDNLCWSGIQVGRIEASAGVADTHHFQDMEIKGYFELAPFYNYASEDLYMADVHLKNDYTGGTDSYCIVQDGDNYWGARSDFTTNTPANTAASFLRNTFIRFDARNTGKGSTVWMSYTQSHDYISSYLVSHDKAAVVLFSNTHTKNNTNLTLDVHMETDSGDLSPDTGLDYGVLFDAVGASTDVQLTGFRFRDNEVHAQESIVAKTTNISTVWFMDAVLDVGSMSRDVGQTVFDDEASYTFSGRFISHASLEEHSFPNIASFQGEAYVNNAVLWDKPITGNFKIEDGRGRNYWYNSIDGMIGSTGLFNYNFMNSSGLAVASVRYTEASHVMSFILDAADPYALLAPTNFRCSADNSMSLGTASNKWSVVYSNTGDINTSDARDKTFIDIEDAERKVALELKKNLSKYKLTEAIQTKGVDNARIHFGIGAQNIKDAFSKHGLDASKYGMFCYDEWEDNEEEEIEAGNAYGVRYSELLCFIISAI